MFKSRGLGGQWIDTRNEHSFSDWTFTQGLKIIGKKPHTFVFCALVPFNRYLALCPSRQSQLLHVASPCSMMTSLITPNYKRYMVTIMLHYVRLGVVNPTQQAQVVCLPPIVGQFENRETYQHFHQQTVPVSIRQTNEGVRYMQESSKHMTTVLSIHLSSLIQVHYIN